MEWQIVGLSTRVQGRVGRLCGPEPEVGIGPGGSCVCVALAAGGRVCGKGLTHKAWSLESLGFPCQSGLFFLY